MNKEAMQQLILEALNRKLGDGFHISIQKVLKTNLELDGLVIRQNRENITPTIYLEPFYEALENGTDIDDVTDRILQDYFSARPRTGHFDTSSLSDFDYVKDRLYVQLINRHSNEKLLQSIPHAMFLDDFAITIRCMVSMSGGCGANFLIHNSHLGMWKTDIETLLSYAMQNTRKMFGVDLIHMKDFIQKAYPETAEADCPIWIMTNNQKLSGAATVLFDNVLRNFANKHGSFYVIFSSVHIPFIKMQLETVHNGKMEDVAGRMAMDHRTLQQTFSGLAFYHLLLTSSKRDTQTLIKIMGDSIYKLPLI